MNEVLFMNNLNIDPKDDTSIPKDDEDKVPIWTWLDGC
jgi:hypothetical protein